MVDRLSHYAAAPIVNGTGLGPKAQVMTDTNQKSALDLRDLALAAAAIFGNAESTVTLPSGKIAVVKPATMRQIPAILQFFQTILNNMDGEVLLTLVEVISDAQQKLIDAGGDPRKMDVSTIKGVEAVNKFKQRSGLLSSLLTAALNAMPAAVTSFTNLTEDEYLDLPPDYGMMVCGGIFMQNYAFFTQSLPPILTEFMKSWASKNPGKASAVIKPVLKRNAAQRSG